MYENNENKYSNGNQYPNENQYQNGNQYPNSFDIKTNSFDNREDKKNKPQNSHPVGRKFLISACSGVIFALCAGTVLFIMSQIMPFHTTQSDATTQVVEEDSVQNKEISEATKVNTSTVGAVTTTDISAVVENAMPSVVAITGMYKVEDQYSRYFGMDYSSEEPGSGSGIIVGQNDTELLIVTNNHVVADATSLSVQFIDDESVDAIVKGTDASIDLALLAIKLENIPESTKNAIEIATLGNSDELVVGEPAIAIGNALGYGQSVTTGVISAVNREYTTEDNVTTYLVQTDAAINPGNSGGALLNIKGEVIGINSNKIGGMVIEGMGYAIPISAAKPIVEELMTKTTREKVDESQKAYLGITGLNVTKEVQEQYGLPEGVYVAQVFENTAAERAGIVKGNIIVSFDGEEIRSMEELSNILASYTRGTTVEIGIMQGSRTGYELVTISAVLGGE